MRFGVKTDRGMVREINEDSYNIIVGYAEVPVSFVIADGMGGHNSGEVASKMAVDIVSDYIIKHPEALIKDEDLLSAIKGIMEKANADVYASSMQNQVNHGMGTTLILAVVYEGVLYIGHVGDSRVYLVREDNIKRITTDHSYIEELIKMGSLTREEAENHPQKNIITRALGCSQDIQIDTYSLEIKDDDIFVLCTDGLTNMICEEEIKNVVQSIDDPEEACAELVNRANKKGGGDNITVVVFKSK